MIPPPASPVRRVGEALIGAGEVILPGKKAQPRTSSGDITVQLKWEDPANGELKELTVSAPVALGRQKEKMPTQWESKSVTRVELSGSKVSRYHALIAVKEGQLVFVDRSSYGTYINGKLLRQSSQPLVKGDSFQIGTYEIACIPVGSESPRERRDVSLIEEEPPRSRRAPARPSTIVFDPETDKLAPLISIDRKAPETESFPPSAFEADLVSVSVLHATGLPGGRNRVRSVGRRARQLYLG